MGEVELATVSFGQSFQITPIQLATTVSAIINGGNRITPHFGISVESADGTEVQTLEYPVETGIVSKKTSRTVRTILETVVSEGSGKTPGSKVSPSGKNSYLSDSAQRFRQIHFFIPGICTGRRPESSGPVHYP